MNETTPFRRPRRLLLVATLAGTVKAFLLPLADHFRSLGWEVDAIANGMEQCGTSRRHLNHVYNIDWSRQPLAFGNLLAIREIQSKVARGEYGIVHVHTPVAGFVTRLALAQIPRRMRPAVVYTVHGFHFHPGNSWLRNVPFEVLERVAGQWTDYLVTINRMDELAALRLGLVSPGQLRYMPGIGIDRGHFRPAAVPISEVAALRRRFGIPDGSQIFAMIAEFISRKRHEDAVRAVSRLRDRNVHLIFVGDGPKREAVKDRAIAEGVRDRVHFAGSQEDVRPFILAARAVILTSSQEGLPRSVLEALSCGVPAIGSDIRGTSDLLSKEGGLLFPCGDVGALASSMDWFLDHPDEAVEMGRRGRDSMECYDTAHILAMHEELYDDARALE